MSHIGDAGLLLACTGCCCGHPERGGPKTPPRILKRELRRALRDAALDGVRLAFTECLGPCSEANVVLLYLHGRPLWLRRVNAVDVFVAVLDYARAAVADPGTPLPESLRARSFAWTGGGVGPAPPIADA